MISLLYFMVLLINLEWGSVEATIVLDIDHYVMPKVMSDLKCTSEMGKRPMIHLNLDKNGISNISTDINHTKTIESMSMKKNNIIYLQGKFRDYFPSLKCLDLTNNAISIEEVLNFFNHSSLEILIMRNQKREEVNVGYKDDSEIVGVYLPRLMLLDLSSTNLDKLPRALKTNTPRLVYLDLSNNTLRNPQRVLSVLPTRLRYLFMDNTGIKHLKVNQKSLRVLSLNGNKFQYIGPSNTLSDLILKNMQNLHQLLLKSCSIEKIYRSAFSGLKHLRFLDLSYNKLESLSNAAIDIPSLQSLSLSNNRLLSLPESRTLKRLEVLSLSYNRFDKVVSQLNNLHALKALTLRGNNLTRFQTDLSGLYNLEILDLSKNHLSGIPSGTLMNLHNLTDFYLDDNEFFHVLSITHGFQHTTLERVSMRTNKFVRVDDDELLSAFPNSVIEY